MGLLDDRGNLAGRKAVIIGGADGIGRAVTLALAGARIDIAFCDINAAAVQSTSAEVAAMGRRVLGETADAVVSDQLQRFYAAAERFLGSADIVCDMHVPPPLRCCSTDLLFLNRKQLLKVISMNASLENAGPAMRALHVSNELLGDQSALRAAWERDGYWFFRDVLDREAIGRARQMFVDYLDELGMTKRSDPQARYIGTSLNALNSLQGYSPTAMEGLAETKVVQRTIMVDPKINAFFERLFGCAPFWVPFTQYRAMPPVGDRNKSRFDLIHYDAMHNDGLPFIICWIPVGEIDADAGGIAVAEGLHRPALPFKKSGRHILPLEDADIPSGSWRRADYRPGDVLLMDRQLPHSGLANYSERFRLSIDTRILPSSLEDLPIVGTLTTVGADRLTVKDAVGEHTLRIDADSYCRDQVAKRILQPELASAFPPGSEVIIATEGARVKNMRPQH